MMNNPPAQPTVFAARAAVIASLNKEIARCATQGAPLAFLLVGLDGFDAIVEAEGEESAEALFAGLLRAVKVHCGRDHDSVLRFSAEGIAAVCPETFPAGAHHVASRILEGAEQLRPGNGTPKATVSVGLAVAAPGGDDSAEALLSRAERCLLSAREKGGNRAVGAAQQATPAAPHSLKSLFRKARTSGASTRRQGD